MKSKVGDLMAIAKRKSIEFVVLSTDEYEMVLKASNGDIKALEHN